MRRRHTLVGMEIAESRRHLSAEDARGSMLVDEVATVADLAAVLQGSPAAASAVCERIASGLGPVPEVPAGAALWVAVVLDTGGVDAERLGWLPLAVSLAAVDALRDASRVPAEATWPDGLTVPGAMCGGDAGTRALGAVAVTPQGDGRVVATVGVLVSLGMLELPKRTTSVYADGGDIDRAALLAAYLPALAHRLAQWRDGDEGLALAYRNRCQTLGRLVEVDGATGRVRGVDDAGRLLVDLGGTLRTVSVDEQVPALV